MDLREARFRAGRISQWDLAKITEVHQSRISLIENGFLAKEDEKLAIADALGFEMDEIKWPE